MRSNLSYTDIYGLLTYDPDAGSLCWRYNRGTRIRAGDDAGTVSPQGYIVVTVKGQKILGHYIAWMLTHGEWPKTRLKLLSTLDPNLPEHLKPVARQDLRIANIVPETGLLSTNPATVRQREYNRNRTASAKAYQEYLARNTASRFLNVAYDDSTGDFTISSVSDGHRLIDYRYAQPRQVLHRYPTLQQAEDLAYQLHANATLVSDERGYVMLPPLLTNHEAALQAGPGGPSLGDINKVLDYDPSTGSIYWRDGHNLGLPAAQPTKGRTLFVQYQGRQLPAHALAWFMTHKYWPKRGELSPRDGNWKNLRIDNWELDRSQKP